MPKVKFEQLKAGMVVGAEVKNFDDMLLMPAGCVLSERHLTILQTWGITEIEIEASEGTEATPDVLSLLGPEVLAQLTAGLQQRFWQADFSQPVPQALFQLLLRRKAKGLLGKK